jgi:ribonuclease HI
MPISTPRNAGIGVFIINTCLQPPQQVYIKAMLKDTASVLMAEAAALALAALVTHHLQLNNVTFLSDNQQLVHFLNGSDLSIPSDWRMKPFTQIIRNSTHQRSTAILKIGRNQNQTADLLARQALSDLDSDLMHQSCVCSNPAHVEQCPLPMTIQLVNINFVTGLTARCC